MPSIDLPLTQDGPIISTVVFPSVPRLVAMLKAKLQPPLPFIGRGLIDTGASGTVIDTSIVKALGLVPTGSTGVHTPSTGTTPHVANCYDVSLWFLSQSPSSAYPAGQPHVVHPSHLTLPVMEADFSLQGIHALIGRDILAHCHLAYDGRNGRFTLTYGNP